LLLPCLTKPNREAGLLADAIAWRDGVIADVKSAVGYASADAHQVPIELIGLVAARVAGYIERGEVMVEPARHDRRAVRARTGAAGGGLSRGARPCRRPRQFNPNPRRQGGSMSGHGKREMASRANAIAWRDRVIEDVRGEGRDAAGVYEVSVDLIIAAAELIAAYMAAGESEISRTDLKRSGYRSGYWISARQEQRLMRYLEDRGHIERCVDRELFRPIGVLPPELPFA
jgi:hypothetical protein